MQKIFFLLTFTFVSLRGWSQGVGIGTTTPNPKAALEIKSTSKGVLFPSLTTAQRDLITNPPDGLHVFNKEEKCLNYYDSVYGIWNCYCQNCETVVIDITSSASDFDFYNVYGKYYTAKRFVVRIAEGVTLIGESNAAIFFSGFPSLAYLPHVSIRIINYGTIIGKGGNGGNGSTHYASPPCQNYYPNYYPDAGPGTNGGIAISAQSNIDLTIDNYGLIGGGGGGGGGGGSLNNGGGGGGGGQGNYTPYYSILFPGSGVGGKKGYKIDVFCDIIGTAQDGGDGSLTSFGLGGAPSASNAWGGNGGGLGEPGLPGLGTLNPGAGGLPGKAVSGGSGTIIHNLGGGQVFGVVD